MKTEREQFEENFKKTEIYKREQAIRQKDILEFSDNFGYFNIVANSAWELWQAAKVDAAPEWISVDDELPNCSDDILMITGCGDVVGGNLEISADGQHHWINDQCDGDWVTYWIPMPKLPKSQEQGNE